jgi:hypothetical protein
MVAVESGTEGGVERRCSARIVPGISSRVSLVGRGMPWIWISWRRRSRVVAVARYFGVVFRPSRYIWDCSNGVKTLSELICRLK